MFESSLTPREKQLARRNYVKFCLSCAIATVLLFVFVVAVSIVIG